MILLTLLDRTLAIEIKYLFGSKKEKLYNTGECMQLFDVVSAEKIIALCARGYKLTASRKHSFYSIFLIFHCILKENGYYNWEPHYTFRRQALIEIKMLLWKLYDYNELHF